MISKDNVSVRKSDKKGFVCVLLEEGWIEATRKIIRKKREDYDFCLVNGHRIYFDDKYNVVKVVKVYDIDNKRKVRSTTEGLSKTVEPIKKREDKKLEENSSELSENHKGPVTECSLETTHEEHDTIKTCVQSNIPVYLYGPAGSGKNHTVERIAHELGLRFYYTNSIQQEYKLTGFINAGGKYHVTEFYKAFTGGGLFFLDEMDASIPEVLVLLNAAIANGYFEFPCGRAQAHKDFRVVAAGNTIGTGADDMYTGRMRLDSATLDRFVLINFDYDPDIEAEIAKGDDDLLEFVRFLREKSKDFSMGLVFSYRCIINFKKLQASGMPDDKIIDICIKKGMEKAHTILLRRNIIDADKSNGKYFKIFLKSC